VDARAWLYQPRQAEADVLRYLMDDYNHQRPHSYNGYKTPVEAESLAG